MLSKVGIDDTHFLPGSVGAVPSWPLSLDKRFDGEAHEAFS